MISHGAGPRTYLGGKNTSHGKRPLARFMGRGKGYGPFPVGCGSLTLIAPRTDAPVPAGPRGGLSRGLGQAQPLAQRQPHAHERQTAGATGAACKAGYHSRDALPLGGRPKMPGPINSPRSRPAAAAAAQWQRPRTSIDGRTILSCPRGTQTVPATAYWHQLAVYGRLLSASF